jgi:MATE family multidrug resistance protein
MALMDFCLLCCCVYVGACKPDAVKRVLHTAIALSLSLTLTLTLPLWAFRRATAKIFTQDPIIINTVVACMPGLLLSLLGDSINTVLSGAVKGSGRQVLGFIVNLCTYWLVGLPTVVLVALHWGYGAPGLWWVMVGVSALQALLLAAFVWKIDWGVEVLRAQHLVRSQSSRVGRHRPGSSSSCDSSGKCIVQENDLESVKSPGVAFGEPAGSLV